MLENEIENIEDYSDELKNELDNRFSEYKLDGIVIEENVANKRIDNLMQKLKSI